LNNRKDSEEYLVKKDFYNQFLTIYGKNSVFEALNNPEIEIHKLHVASNKNKNTLKKLKKLANERKVEVNVTTSEQVSRISKNGRQDQGIAADIKFKKYITINNFFSNNMKTYKLLALDGITTPANAGMIIRSAAAGGMDGIIIPKNGCCGLNPMVIKSSAGTIFSINVIHCSSIEEALTAAKNDGASISTMDANSHNSLFDYMLKDKEVFILGSESSGVSKTSKDLKDNSFFIPMADNIESLNVAMSATLISYYCKGYINK
jgi:23S rRNA (guanosine2251-2'-O)-methyltransferase